MLNFQERELHRQKGLMNQTISVFDRKKCQLKNMEFSYCGEKTTQNQSNENSVQTSVGK